MTRTTTSLRASVAMAVDHLVARIEDLEAENARLTRENETLWASVHEAQDAVTELRAMNERAREDA